MKDNTQDCMHAFCVLRRIMVINLIENYIVVENRDKCDCPHLKVMTNVYLWNLKMRK